MNNDVIYKALVEQSLVGIYLITDRVFCYVNEKLAQIFGYEPDEIIGRLEPLDLTWPEDHTLVREAICKRLEEETEAVHYRFRGRRKDGSIIHCEAFGRRIDYQGRSAILGSLIDLTDRVKVEEALQQYAERLRFLREIDQAILAARSPETVAQAVVSRIQRLIPCQRTSVVLFDTAAGEAKILAVNVEGETRLGANMRVSLADYGLEQELRQGKIHFVEDLASRPSPSTVEQILLGEGIRSYISAPLWAGKEVIGAFNLGFETPRAFAQEHLEIAREVADTLAIAIQQSRLHEQIQRHAEQLEVEVARRTRELAESESRYRQIVESPLVGIWHADTEGHLVYVNSRLAEMLGYTPEEVIGKMTMFDAIAPERHAWLAERIAARVAGEAEPDIVEADVIRKDGTRLTVLAAPATLHNADGRVIGLIGALIDITERKRLEQELARQLEYQRRLVQAMAGREVRMAELKEVIRQLRAQLIAAGLPPAAHDPVLEELEREDTQSLSR